MRHIDSYTYNVYWMKDVVVDVDNYDVFFSKKGNCK